MRSKKSGSPEIPSVVMEKAGTSEDYREPYNAWVNGGKKGPFHFTSERVLQQPTWADPMDPRKVDFAERLKAAGDFSFDEFGRPVNPHIPKEAERIPEGRGLLGKWGPNFAGDNILTRMGPNGSLQVLLIERKKRGEGWALPGGMVDPGEFSDGTAIRELIEETFDVSAMGPMDVQEVEDFLKKYAKEVFSGPVDDPRNTKNAWMRTKAFHASLPPEISSLLKFKPQEGEVQQVAWIDIERLAPGHPEYLPLFASHAKIMARGLESLRNSTKLHALAQENSLSVSARNRIQLVLQAMEGSV